MCRAVSSGAAGRGRPGQAQPCPGGRGGLPSRLLAWRGTGASAHRRGLAAGPGLVLTLPPPPGVSAKSWQQPRSRTERPSGRASLLPGLCSRERDPQAEQERDTPPPQALCGLCQGPPHVSTKGAPGPRALPSLNGLPGPLPTDTPRDCGLQRRGSEKAAGIRRCSVLPCPPAPRAASLHPHQDQPGAETRQRGKRHNCLFPFC